MKVTRVSPSRAIAHTEIKLNIEDCQVTLYVDPIYLL